MFYFCLGLFYKKNSNPFFRAKQIQNNYSMKNRIFWSRLCDKISHLAKIAERVSYPRASKGSVKIEDKFYWTIPTSYNSLYKPN